MQELHLPLFVWPRACPACIFGGIVTFRPEAGRLVVTVAGKQALVEAVRASAMVGELLDVEIE